MSLSVGTALRDGWTMFRRTHWTFVFFVLFAFVLSTVVDLVPGFAVIIISILVDLWATVGLIRGAWLGLNGQRPSFGDLIKINCPDIWRLFSRQFLLTLLLGVISTTAAIVAVTAADAGEIAQSIFWRVQGIDPSNFEAINRLITEIQSLAFAISTSPVSVLVLLIGAVIAIYIQVNQLFLGLVAVVKGIGPSVNARWASLNRLGGMVPRGSALLQNLCCRNFFVLSIPPIILNSGLSRLIAL